jgi:hypothetical protein
VRLPEGRVENPAAFVRFLQFFDLHVRGNQQRSANWGHGRPNRVNRVRSFRRLCFHRPSRRSIP